MLIRLKKGMQHRESGIELLHQISFRLFALQSRAVDSAVKISKEELHELGEVCINKMEEMFACGIAEQILGTVVSIVDYTQAISFLICIDH